MSDQRRRGWAALVAIALIGAAAVVLFLPYRASSEPGLFGSPDAPFEGITIDCGNFFSGISGGPEPPEIVAGSEELAPLPQEVVLTEIIEANDACTRGGLIRVSIAGALLVLALVLVLAARRTARRDEPTTPPEG